MTRVCALAAHARPRASPAAARRTRASSAARSRGSGSTSTPRSSRRSRRRRRTVSRPRSRPGTGPRRRSRAAWRRCGRAALRPGAPSGLAPTGRTSSTTRSPSRSRRSARPTVLTLLDVQHLDLPQLFPRGERLFRRLAYDRAARRASQVVVISEWVRERVVERLGLDPDRVHAVHLGVDHERFTPDPAVEREPFLYYPARPWPHKNHARLYEAFARLRAEPPELRLVLTGAGQDAARLPDGGRGARRRPGRERGRPLPPRRRARRAEPLRGVRAAAARGDGVRLPGGGLGGRLAAGGRRRRGRPLRPARPRRDRRRASRRRSRAPPSSRTSGSRAPRRFTWEATARAHDRVYALAAAS